MLERVVRSVPIYTTFRNTEREVSDMALHFWEEFALENNDGYWKILAFI